VVHELVRVATPTEEASSANVAKAKGSVGMAREDAERRRAAAPPRPVAAAPEPQAAALRDEAASAPSLDADAAAALLGRAPALLPGRPVRRVLLSPTDQGVVIIEQEWKPGIVLRLYERRAISAQSVDAAPPSSKRARSVAPSAQMALPRESQGENLARYINSLRVEISGPIAADSLAAILDSVE